jgi:hypothetical protein
MRAPRSAAGLKQAIVDAIAALESPDFDDDAEFEVYEFTRALQQTGRVPADTYDAVLRRWGARGVVELTAVIGYYTMVAQTLNAHQLPLPEGATGLAAREHFGHAAAGAATGARRDGGRLRDRAGAGRRPCRPGRCRPTRATRIFTCSARTIAFLRPARPLYALPEATPQAAATLRKTPGPDARRARCKPTPYRQQSRCHAERPSRTRPDTLRGIAVADPDTDSRHTPGSGAPRASSGSASSRCVHPMAGAIPAASASMPSGCGAAHAGGWPSRPAMGQARLISRTGCRICCGRRCRWCWTTWRVLTLLRGPNAAAFKSILARLADSDVWAKLTICRVSQQTRT